MLKNGHFLTFLGTKNSCRTLAASLKEQKIFISIYPKYRKVERNECKDEKVANGQTYNPLRVLVVNQ